ncbi:hypothetical protein MKUB_55880 [Mycobacterium kubicae]|uniref:Uncharacterized protein n=1 Tax=Mycobacterium kubicae TaxID=120959 RepID=A0AAX1J4K4_9MYCO|nr:hypothetical protein [Mycobacterium kubicae]MCV7094095.1 hypothetical protein [Mycobacterium kubicae]ORV98441.1 hypothetical protein AWC13_13385 [Mycobacterium kubicae]QNI12537.1 hypothetical protein GAN18_16130 [Mycobacterium kubicae]QPI36062.1 hypothetical protein I2456_15925 [Mycobacterium kubicae]GFG68098.1 hypothetical protein MKUB_55880 [Mycobacterium kubicae]
MTTIAPAAPPAPTDEQVEQMILDTLAETREELVPWAWLRRRLPVTGFWRALAALDRLWLDGRVYVIRVRGCNYVGLGDEHDMRMAARAKAQGRVPAVRCV